MKIIPPSKISGEIFTLIDEADQFLVLVSPYIQISGWYKLTNRLENIIERDVKFKMFVRDGQRNLKSIDELKHMGITPYLIPNLHAKVYFNEKSAITTSMNLLRSSDQYSKEIGHLTETRDEYSGIIDYYKRYIQPFAKNVSGFDKTLEDEIDARLQEYERLYIDLKYKFIKINTGNNHFEASIEKKKDGRNTFVITGILSKDEFEQKQRLIDNYQFSEDLEINFDPGRENEYDLVVGESTNKIESRAISDVVNQEKELIAELIASFIRNVESFKSDF